ncbi:MAG: hypothetical protein ABWZ25_18475 [Chitinophagaceae bacterium]
MKNILCLFVLYGIMMPVAAQIDPTLLRRVPVDTVKKTMNMDAVYNRPFVAVGKLPVSIGGYMEANWQRLGTDGISEGNQFQFRRLTLFISSTIGPRLKFLSEIEFEDGAKEIAIEFAALDIELDPLFNLRGGMILNPIGAFNQNHDGPKWEFVDRPFSAVQLLPDTWSNAGFGVYGKYYRNKWMFGYEAYVSGSFDNSIIDNKENKTFLPAAKLNPERFEEINSGLPLLTAKLAARNNDFGEIGISYMGGVYNKFEDDGLRLDKRRRVDVLAVDFNSSLPRFNTFFTGEWAWVFVDVPTTFSQQYGNRQRGGFVDIVQPVLKKKMFNWDKAVLNLACRFEYVDWNVGRFHSTGGKIAEDLWSIVPAISFRPVGQTVLRLNYRIQRQQDLLGNPPSHTGGFQFGISTYF